MYKCVCLAGLRDLFSSPVPDFSKVHKISACSMPGGVQTKPVKPVARPSTGQS